MALKAGNGLGQIVRCHVRRVCCIILQAHVRMSHHIPAPPERRLKYQRTRAVGTVEHACLTSRARVQVCDNQNVRYLAS